MWHWVDFLRIHFFQENGTDSASSRAYNFWSGFGSDLTEFGALGFLIAWYHRINCDGDGCWWRRGRYEYIDGEGNTSKLCVKCYPIPRVVRSRKQFLEHHAERMKADDTPRP
jgi:hypothetical protein